MAYEPRYCDLDDLPLQGPGDVFDPSDLGQAAKHAEAQLESEVNDGRRIDNPEAIHEKAALAYATYMLFSGPEHPSSANAGDFSAGSGEDVMEVAREMKSMYRDAVSTIMTADDDAGGGEFVV